ncbi:MAG: hypothetical protein M1821_002411 [Bathelium mastoideum]|nr:MAG: hypothetical protein M1821_002411 [Bathelium mastoideum]KAI9686379.1 MAG: hypothetical protein M1822_003724 [Bathelium mastoideum]
MERSLRQNSTMSDLRGSKPLSAHRADGLPRPGFASRSAPVKSKFPAIQIPRDDSVPSMSAQTPSLTSGSSVSTNDSPRHKTLRRKPSSIEKYTAAAYGDQTGSGSLPATESLSKASGSTWESSVLGISVRSASPESIFPERTQYASKDIGQVGKDAGAPLNPGSRSIESATVPHTPGIPLSESPSTRYSESPGLFSHASTPTSMSSYSPGLLSSKFTPRARTISPSQQTRPPVVRRKMTPDQHPSTTEAKGLAVVQEVSNPSSSVSRERIRGPSSHVQNQDSKPEPKQRPTIQTPPELAHLLNDPPLPKTTSKPERPARPSRDGTPNLGSREPSPIIQSNLPSLFNSYHRRQGSAGTNNSGGLNNKSSDSIASLAGDATRVRLAVPTKISSRNPSPANNPQSRSTTPLEMKVNTSIETLPDPHGSAASSETQKASPLVASEASSKPSRFGFFARRTKGENALPSGRPKREPRKGPMAGTGHEGYGRRPMRGRRVSTTSTDSRGRSPSAGSTSGSMGGPASTRKGSFGSNTEDSPVDEFVSERLTPVFLRGEGGYVKNDRTSWDLTSDMSNQSTPQLSEGDSRRSSDDKPPVPPKARTRAFRSPSPLKGRLLGQKPPAPHTDMPAHATGNNDGGKSKRDQSKAPQKPNKRWNFFQRTHNTSKKNDEMANVAQDSRQLTHTFEPHYAMIRDEERLDLDDIERMMQDAGGYSSVEEFDDVQTQPIPTLDTWSNRMDFPEEKNRKEGETHVDVQPEQIGQRHTPSILLPSPPALDRPFSPQDRLLKISLQSGRPHTKSTMKETTALVDDFNVDHDTAVPVTKVPAPDGLPSDPGSPPKAAPSPGSPGRPSRLTQIGRIPQVVSKRDRDRKLPNQSFSRPFANGQPRPNVNRRSRSDSVKQISPMETRRESITETQPLQTFNTGREGSDTAQAVTTTTSICAADITTNPPELFKFPPRHDSEISYTSSSGNGSFPGQFLIFSPQLPTNSAAEDVWNEYDDLIDDVISPIDEPISAKSALGAPFQYQATTSSKSEAGPNAVPASNEAGSGIAHSSDKFADPIRRSSTAPLTTSLLRQQRSSFLSALHSDSTRESGFTELIKGYAERNVSPREPKKDRLSLPPSTRPSSTATRFSLSPTAQSPASSSHSRSATATEYSQQAPMRTNAVKRESEDMYDQANLRFGALMTSKWLSFGRVLFSPAHTEVKEGKDSRVLIIDGLGKDWSYYCALTYPSTTVYNLGPTPTSSQTGTANAWQSLSNHRHIHHPAISSPFPFPRGFFAAVVFRFPVAASEAAYRAALSECKRVLRPGGHLELSILDIDMLNMGNKARRAVRQMKMKMQQTQPDVCLKPKSDSTLRLLGMRGYESINRCVVGVPAAGILGSAASSPTSSENGDHNIAAGKMSEDKRESGVRTSVKGTPNGSFGDILRSNPNAKESGVGVTKMVSRVGRWWWSSCYETPFLAEDGASRSIWDDPSFLRECEEQGTSFKLLICYAQKPDMSVRRTVSV